MLGFLIHYSEGLRLLGFQLLGFYCNTQRLHSSSFLGLADRILSRNHNKELLWSLRVNPKPRNSADPENSEEFNVRVPGHPSVPSSLRNLDLDFNMALPIGPKVVPFWDYLIEF